MVLRASRDPVRREEDELRGQVVDILPAHDVGLALIVVAEGEQLVERVVSAARVTAARGTRANI